MAFSSGTYSLYTPGNPVVTGTTIASTWANNTLNDIATALSTCVLKDGTQTLTANIPMSSFKFTGLGAGSAAGNSTRWEQTVGLITAVGSLLAGTAAGTLAEQTVGATGTILVPSSGATNGVAYAGNSLSPVNVGLAASVAGSALTITLQGANGSNQSATNPGVYPFRNVTVGTGTPTWLNGTAASTLVISSGSTMGARNGIPFRLWIVMFNDGGTLRLGAINCVTSVAGAGAGSDVTAIYPLSAWGIASSTAEGGAGAADNAQTFYTGTAVSSKAFTVLGYATWETGLTTAGTWDAAPTRLHLFGAGVPLPGQIVQVQRNQTGAVATGTTVVPNDDTIPQITEGDQYMSQAITPSSAANVLDIEALAHVANNQANERLISSLYQDATANALASGYCFNASGGVIVQNVIRHQMLAATSSSTTLRVRSGSNAAGTTTFNGEGAARLYGGVLNSFMKVAEVMG